MKKIHIVITPNALKELVSNPWDYSVASGRLKQHILVFSDTMIDEYERVCAENDCVYDWHGWYYSLNHYDLFEEAESVSEDFYIDATTILKQYGHSIIISHNDDIDCKAYTVIELKDINSDHDNELTRQCIPASFMLLRDYPKSKFCKWLKELLVDERHITIIDKYIMVPRNHGVLEDIYIPTFPETASIEIYHGEIEDSKPEVETIKNAFNNRIRLFGCRFKDYHERHIIGDSIRITIGVGLDVFNCVSCGSRVDAQITVTQQTDIPYPEKSRPRALVYR